MSTNILSRSNGFLQGTGISSYGARADHNHDALMGSIVAPEYENVTFPVTEGKSYCTRDGKFYVAATDIATEEEWNAEHWSETDVASQLGSAQVDPEDIAEAVTEWLGDHVDPETGYVIDDSLTVEGAAADAKKTGDEISDLKSAIGNLYTTEVVDSNATESDGFYSAGSFSSLNTTHNFKARVGKSTKVKIIGKINKNYDIYDFLDESNTVISYLKASSNTNADTEYDVPEGAVYVVSSNVKTNGNITILVSDEVSVVDEMKNDLSEIGDAFSFATNNRTAILESENIHGFYSDGSYSANANTNTVRAVVAGLDKVRVSGVATVNYDFCDFLSKDGVVLSKEKATTNYYYNKEYEVPAGAYYVVSSNNGEFAAHVIYKYAPSDLPSDVVGEKRVCLLKDDTDIYVRSSLDSEYDIIVTARLHGSSNGSFNFIDYRKVDKSQSYTVVEGTDFKNASDDICPLYFAGSYRGGNHGDGNVALVTTTNGHGLTESNIGQVWEDANGIEFIILKVPNTTQLVVGNYVEEDTPFSGTLPSTSLSYNGTTITLNTVAGTQLRSGINNISVKVCNEFGDEITGTGFYYGNHFDVIESYGIVDVDAMIAYLIDNVGDNTNASCSDDSLPCYCTVTNIFRFTEQGTVTVYTTTEWEKAFSTVRCGYVQSSTIGRYYSVPKTTSMTDINYQNASVYVGLSDWKDSDVPPDRFYQYADQYGNKGVALGYYTEIGCAKPSERKNTAPCGLYNDNTWKMYPYIFDGSVAQGDMLNAVSYRLVFDNYSDGLACVSWYYVGDNAYLVINSTESFDGYIPLPDHFIGKLAEIVESDGVITLKSSFVNTKGLRVAITDYASATIKLS